MIVYHALSILYCFDINKNYFDNSVTTIFNASIYEIKIWEGIIVFFAIIIFDLWNGVRSG